MYGISHDGTATESGQIKNKHDGHAFRNAISWDVDNDIITYKK